MSQRSVTVLGATGSIGKATLDVLAAQGDAVRVANLVGGRDVAALAAAARRMRAARAIIADERCLSELQSALADTGIEVAAGTAAVLDAASEKVDWTMAAISGTAGLGPTLAAARRGGTLALATKECVVSAGSLFLDAVEHGGAQLLPVDSEHNAIFQALAGAPISHIKKMTLTASGGPFRCWSSEEIKAATLDDALRHPTWTMGSKITIDSATMMNKGLELIEASYLFAVPALQIDVVIHPQSIVHGLVEFKDGSVVAGLAPADMRVAIAHAFGFPQRIDAAVQSLDLTKIGTLTFEAPDEDRFPALRIARACLERGDGAMTAMNAANEVAVHAFLERRISFGDIIDTVSGTLDALDSQNDLKAPQTLDDVLFLDERARAVARSTMERFTRQTAPALR